MNKEEIKQALIKFDREDLLNGEYDIYLDDSVEVFLTISQMIKFNNQQKKIDQLTNNWNELRQHIKDYLEEWENSDDEWVKGKCDMARDILYDMEEIKEGK